MADIGCLWKRPSFALATWFLLLGTAPMTVLGTDTNSTQEALRPFYILGHGANRLSEADSDLRRGANGIECDVEIMAGHSNLLCIGHGPDLGTGPAAKGAVRLTNYLQGLHELARKHTNFCLVYFDCKTLTASPDLGWA